MIQDQPAPNNLGEMEKTLSPEKKLKSLLEKEWSIGSGQCPVCRGVNEEWHGHPLFTDPGKIGHSTWCQLAESIQKLGGKALFVGTYKSKKQFETYWKTFIDLQGFEHRLLGSRQTNR